MKRLIENVNTLKDEIYAEAKKNKKLDKIGTILYLGGAFCMSLGFVFDVSTAMTKGKLNERASWVEAIETTIIKDEA